MAKRKMEHTSRRVPPAVLVHDSWRGDRRRRAASARPTPPSPRRCAASAARSPTIPTAGARSWSGGRHEGLPPVWAEQASARPADDVVAAGRPARAGGASDGLAVPEAVLRRVFDHNVARVHRLLDHGADLLDRFAAADIRAVPLKGLHSLLAGAWPDPAARTMADLDVLVDAEHATRAYELLLTSGYEKHPDLIGEHADHHLPMLSDGDVTVELHVEPLVSRWRALVPAARMLRPRDVPTDRACGRPAARRRHGYVRAPRRGRAAAGGDPPAARPPAPRLLETSCSPPGGPLARRPGGLRGRRGAHVLDVDLHATRTGSGRRPPESSRGARSGQHPHPPGRAGGGEPAAGRVDLRGAGAALVRAERMHEEFGPGEGAAWLWRARARHADGGWRRPHPTGPLGFAENGGPPVASVSGNSPGAKIGR